MCLLHYLWSSAEERKIEVFAAHYDHQLRGLESARDRTFVRDWCRDREIPCAIESGAVMEYARQNHMGLEEAGRVLRYRFLEKTAEEMGCDLIATAHNADDNLETVLLNMTRGCGLNGLCGIPVKRGKVIRPLLGTTRSEILQYLEEQHLEHVEDSSNRDEDYSRNKIRGQVVPLLREINPAVVKNVQRMTRILRSEEEVLEQQAEECLDRAADGENLRSEILREVPEPVAARVLKKFLNQTLDEKSVRKILEMTEQTEYRQLDVPRARIVLEHGRLSSAPEEVRKIPDREIVIGQKCPVPEAGLEITAEITENENEIHQTLNTFYFKCESINGTLFCTSWKDGDRIRLAERKCTKKLKALFDEAGLTKQQKMTIPVIRDEKSVVAVGGFGISEYAEASPGDRAIKITISKMENKHDEKST